MELFKINSQGGFTEKPNTGGTDKDSKKSAKDSLENSTKIGYKCESWATTDILDAELGMNGYVMFRKVIIRRRGGGVILYIKESIQAYEIKLE